MGAAAAGASSVDLDENGYPVFPFPLDFWDYVGFVFSVFGIVLGVYLFYKTFKLKTYFLVPAQIVLLLLIAFCVMMIEGFYLWPHSSSP